MKVAISVPDDVFRSVEHAAKRLKISRSELFSRAARAFLDEQRGRDVTESYDRAFGPEAAGAAPDDETARFRREATRRALLDVEWR
jgi:hypothetical protein